MSYCMRFLINSFKIFALTILVSCNQEKKDQEVLGKEQHPNLILTKKSVAEIRSKLGSIPLFDKTLAETKLEVDQEIAKGIDVPVPKDMAGGYPCSFGRSSRCKL